jgi:hypothetical protein
MNDSYVWAAFCAHAFRDCCVIIAAQDIAAAVRALRATVIICTGKIQGGQDYMF